MNLTNWTGLCPPYGTPLGSKKKLSFWRYNGRSPCRRRQRWCWPASIVPASYWKVEAYWTRICPNEIFPEILSTLLLKDLKLFSDRGYEFYSKEFWYNAAWVRIRLFSCECGSTQIGKFDLLRCFPTFTDSSQEYVRVWRCLALNRWLGRLMIHSPLLLCLYNHLKTWILISFDKGTCVQWVMYSMDNWGKLNRESYTYIVHQ